MNDSIDQNLPLARYEYTNHLNHFLVPLIYKGFTSIYDDAKELCVKNEKENETLMYFQTFLKRIPHWNATILEKESDRIKQDCPFLMKIVTAIFTSYVKILSSVRIKGENSNIKIKIPMCDVFIHSVYINSAKVLFYKPELFKTNVDTFTKRKNSEEIEEIITFAINESLCNSIPIENILQEYIGNIYEDEEIEEEDFEEENSEDGASVYCEEENENEENEYENEENEYENENENENEYENEENEYENENENEYENEENEYEEETKVINFGNKHSNKFIDEENEEYDTGNYENKRYHRKKLF